MPTLSQRQTKVPDTYRPVDPPVPFASSGIPSLEPTYSTRIRCPLPPVAYTPDSSKLFYRGGTVPQSRILTPTTLSVSPTGSTITNAVVAGSSSSSSTTLPAKNVATNAAITTPVLDPGEQFFGVLTMAKTYDLLQVSVSAAARVRIYETASEQAQDAGRDDETALPAGTSQGIVADVTIDSDPMQWFFTPIATGTSDENPRSPSVFVTIDNVGSGSNSITASILYLPTESSG